MSERLEQRVQLLEQELSKAKENEKLLRYIISIMPGHVYWLDRENKYLGCNETQAKDLALRFSDEIIGKSNVDFHPRENAEEIDRINRLVMEKDQIQEIEEFCDMVLAPGHYLSKKVPLHNEAGEVVGLLGISFNITERRRMEEELKAANDRIKAMAGSIAHELRTPLGTVGMGIGTVDSVLADPTEENLSFAHETLQSMRKEIDSANTIINMLLMNIREQMDWQKDKMEICSMNHCIEEALRRYPFVENQKEKVTWRKSKDFEFKGNAIFMQHVIFNLLKNALLQIDKAGKGEITIWTEKGKDGFSLHFKDTASGVPQEILPHLFERFFSRTKNGTGLGLAFCKMVIESFGGEISSYSEEGKFSEFVVRFKKTEE